MTADPPGCPDCGAAFRPGSPRCPRCSLPLVGPLAGELWQVDQQLARLGARRRQLLAALRDARPSPGEAPSVAASPRTAETRPPSVQNLLLGLGVFLLAVAAAIFVAVAWGRLGVGAKALVLLVVTTVTVLAVPLARRRGLVATGEALAALAVGLALLDAHGLRRADLFALARPDARLYWAGATLLVALVAAAGSARVGAGAWRYAAVALGQLPTPLLAGWLADAGHPAGAAVLLGAQTLSLSAAATRWMSRAPGVRGRAGLRALLAAGAVLAWVVAVGFALSAAYPRPAEAVLPGVLALLVLAAVAAAAAALAGPAAPSRHPAAFAAAGAVAAAAYAPVARALDGDGRLVALAGIVLLLLLGTAVVPAAWRPGPVGVALVIAAGTMAAVADPTVLALAGPLSWLTDPWSADAAGGARGLVAVGRTWSGGVPVPIVLGSATLAAALAGALLARPRVTVAAGAARATPMLGTAALGTAALGTAALGTAATLTVSLGLNLGYPAALGLDLTLGAALLVCGARAGRRRAGVLLAACGAVVVLHTVAWALAATPATLVTLAAAAGAALTAGLLAAAALASPVPSGAVLSKAVLSKAALSGAALLTAAEMFALARAAHAPVARAGFLLALAGLGVVAAGTARRRRPDGPWLEVSGALAYVAGLTAALADPGWTSYALAAGGLAALAVALRAERRRVAWVGAALLTGSGWVRLSLERVGAPEAYLAPLGAVAIGLGHLRRTRDPAVSSWRAYGAGLGLALLPSLLVILDGDPGLPRPLLLGLAALVALLAGARARLAAPLIVGAGVLGVDAAVQLAPLAAALPRWVSIGAIGLLLLALGATYERRLRDLRRLRASLSRLG